MTKIILLTVSWLLLVSNVIAELEDDDYFENGFDDIDVVDRNNSFHRCSVPWIVNSLLYRTYLSPDTLLVLSNKRSAPWMHPLIVNTQNCSYMHAYNPLLPRLGNQCRLFKSSTFNGQRYVLVVNGKSSCQGHKWCRLHFDPLFRKLEPLYFDFKLVDVGALEPLGSFDSDRFAVAFNNDEGTFFFRHYDMSANRTGPLYKELFNLPHYNFLGMKISGLSYCWSVLAQDLNYVQCLRLRDDGSVMINKTIHYPNLMKLYEVQTIPHGLVLFSSKYRCDSNKGECAILHVTLIKQTSESMDCDNCSSSTLSQIGNEFLQVKHRRYNVGCDIECNYRSSERCGDLIVPLTLEILMKDSNDSMEIKSMCDNQKPYDFQIFSV